MSSRVFDNHQFFKNNFLCRSCIKKKFTLFSIIKIYTIFVKTDKPFSGYLTMKKHFIVHYKKCISSKLENMYIFCMSNFVYIVNFSFKRRQRYVIFIVCFYMKNAILIALKTIRLVQFCIFKFWLFLHRQKLNLTFRNISGII